MAYVKRSKKQIVTAYAAALRTDPEPESRSILVDGENLSPKEVAEALERGDPKVVNDLIPLVRECARDLDEDPLKIVRSDVLKPRLHTVL